MNLLKAVSTVSALTLASRITGLAREILLAWLLGAGMARDAFEVAFRAPNMLRRFFAEGAFSQAFVPILGEYRARRGDEAVRLLVDRVSTLLGLAVFAVAVLGVVAAPGLAYLLAAGFAQVPGKVELTVGLLHVLFPYVLFVSLVSVFAAALNSVDRFAAPAFAPVLLNLAVIGAAAWAFSVALPAGQAVRALAWGVFAGGVVQVAWMLGALRRAGFRPLFRLAPADPGVRRVLALMLPALLGVSVAQVSLLVNTQLASFLPQGSVSWLAYADRLMEFPTALLGVALGTVILPSLARHHARDDQAAYSRLLDWGLRVTVLLTLPAALGLAMLAVPVIATLFARGAFTAHDVLQTRSALAAYSVGLIGLIAVKVLAPAFYARQDIATPVRVAIASLVVTQLVNLVVVFPGLVGLPVPWGLRHAGLALSVGLGACFNAGALLWLLRRRRLYAPGPGWGRFAARVAVALVALAAVLHASAGSPAWWLDAGLAARAGRLAGVLALGAAAYFGALLLLGLRPRDISRGEDTPGPGEGQGRA